MDPVLCPALACGPCCLVTPLAGALGSRLHLWPWWIGFAICLIGALVSLVLLVRLPWSHNRYASGLGALPLLLPLTFVLQALRMPLINDVSTDPTIPSYAGRRNSERRRICQ